MLDTQTSMLAINLSKRRAHHLMNARIQETLDEKPFQRVDARLRCVPRRLDRGERVNASAAAQTDTAIQHRMAGNPAQQKRDAWTQAHANQDCRQSESSFLRPAQRTAQEPFGRLTLWPLSENRRRSVRDDADGCVALRGDHPEAPDVRAKGVSRLPESNVGTMHDRAADAHTVLETVPSMERITKHAACTAGQSPRSHSMFIALRVNRSSAATIQVADGQAVITTGPYARVRHPMSAGASFLFFGTPLALAEYMPRVRYRFIPGLL